MKGDYHKFILNLRHNTSKLYSASLYVLASISGVTGCQTIDDHFSKLTSQNFFSIHQVLQMSPKEKVQGSKIQASWWPESWPCSSNPPLSASRTCKL